MFPASRQYQNETGESNSGKKSAKKNYVPVNNDFIEHTKCVIFLPMFIRFTHTALMVPKLRVPPASVSTRIHPTNPARAPSSEGGASGKPSTHASRSYSSCDILPAKIPGEDRREEERPLKNLTNTIQVNRTAETKRTRTWISIFHLNSFEIKFILWCHLFRAHSLWL